MRKRLLYITTDSIPLPFDTGGKLRTANILIQLSKEYDIDFVTFSMEPVRQAQVDQAMQYCKTVQYFSEKVPSKRKRILNFLRFRSNKAFVVYSKNMQAAVDKLLYQEEYSFIFLERLYTFPYVEEYLKKQQKTVPVILNMHDVEFEAVQFFRKTCSSVIKKLYFNFEYFNVCRLEKKAFSMVTKVITVSERDMKLYQQRYQSHPEKWMFVNNGTDLSLAEREPIAERDQKTVLFIGSLKHPPNLHGLNWFLDHVWTDVQNTDPEIQFEIIGSGEISQEDRRKLTEKKGVQFLGFVENIYPLLRRATCLVVPLLSGSGTRIKILEAFSFELPVVSTSIGAEGLPVADGEHLLLADEPKDMGDALIKLLHSKALQQSLAANGLQLIKKEYDWDIVGEKLRNELNHID